MYLVGVLPADLCSPTSMGAPVRRPREYIILADRYECKQCSSSNEFLEQATALLSEVFRAAHSKALLVKRRGKTSIGTDHCIVAIQALGIEAKATDVAAVARSCKAKVRDMGISLPSCLWTALDMMDTKVAAAEAKTKVTDDEVKTKPDGRVEDLDV